MLPCATPGCPFAQNSRLRLPFQRFCCIACAEGDSHGPRCSRQRVPRAPAPPVPAAGAGGVQGAEEVERVDILKEAREQVKSGRDTGDKEEEAAGLLLTAELQLGCDLKDAALQSATDAREACRALGKELLEAQALRLAVKAQLASGKQRLGAVKEKKEREQFERAGKRAAAAVMLLACSDVHLAAGEPSKALKAANTALATFQQIGDIRWQVRALHQAGEVQKLFNGADEMLALVRKAAPLLEELGDAKEEAMMMEIKSHAYQVLGDPHKALEATLAGLELSRSANDKIGEGAALNNVANAYLMMPDGAAEGLEAARQAFEHCTATGNKREAFFALCEMVSAYCALERLDDAIEAQRKAVDLARERGDTEQVKVTSDNLTYLRSMKGAHG